MEACWLVRCIFPTGALLNSVMNYIAGYLEKFEQTRHASARRLPTHHIRKHLRRHLTQ
jgi:hypothetical protein